MRLYKAETTRDGQTFQSQFWTFYHTEKDHQGHTKAFRQSTREREKDKAYAAAWRIVEEWRVQDLRRKEGLDAWDESKGKHLNEWVYEFQQVLLSRGVKVKNINLKINRVSTLIELCGAQYLQDLTTEAIRRSLARLSRKPKSKNSKPKPLTARTINHYKGAMNQLFRWLLSEGHWHKNPVTPIPDTPVVVERPRFALSLEQVSLMLDAAPRHRWLVYKLCHEIGLRRREMNTLKLTDVDLDRGRVTVHVKRAKSRKAVSLPISETLAAEWREYKEQGVHFRDWADAPPSALTNEMPLWCERISQGLALPPVPTVHTVRRDVAKAGIEIPDDYTFDLHSIRVTCATNLLQLGVNPKVVQEILRHADISTTMNVYARVIGEDRRDAVELLNRAIDGRQADQQRAG